MVAIVIPSLNPEPALQDYCGALRSITDSPILLVDDGSDAARRPIFDECAKSVPGVEVVRHDVNRGKGRALKTAFARLLAKYPALIGCVTADSDGQHAPEDVLRCIEAIRAQPDALVLGARDFSQSHVPWKSSFGNNGMRLFFRITTGRNFLDTQTGLRAIPADMMRELIDTPGERFEFESRMLLVIHDRPLVQLPIRTIYENENKGTHFNPFSDSTKICWLLLCALVREFGLFIVASLLSFGVDIGMFWLLYYAVFNAESHAHLMLSIGLARVVSATFNYLVNRFVVFAESSKRHAFGARAPYKYAALAIAMVVASYLLTKLGNAMFRGANLVVVKSVVDLLLFVASFLVQRVFVFRPQ